MSYSKVRSSLAQGQLREAIAEVRTLLDEKPDSAEGWLVLSEIQDAAGNFQQALAACDKALSLAPGSVMAMLQYCRCAMALGKHGERVHLLARQLSQLPLTDPYQLNELGRLCASIGEHARAETHYSRAIALRGDELGFHYNLATAQRFLGKLQEAEISLERVLRFNPRDTDAFLLLSGLRRQSRDHNHTVALQRLLNDGGLKPRERVNLCFALAKELEDLGRFEASFEHLQAGAQLRRQNMRYELQGDLAVMHSLKENFSKDFFTNIAGRNVGCDSSEPIFILGMPRTGSTLLERILSSHYQVQSAGELNNFALQMMAAVRAADSGRGNRRSKLQLIEASRHIDFAALGQRYIDSARPLTGEKPHFIDKLPFNYLYIGLIHAALPNARIIHVKRDPVDTCYSVYKQLFENAYPFSYDQDEMAQYFLAYRKLMDHWHRVLPGRIHEVEYENLVGDAETAARGVFDYCDLEWQPECLDFQANQKASVTASAAQVRQPIYRSSVGKWRIYREQLQPMLEVLRKGGIEIE